MSPTFEHGMNLETLMDLDRKYNGDSSFSTQQLRGQAIKPDEFLSPTEQAILRSKNPLLFDGASETLFFGQKYLWLNKSEVNAWKGEINLDHYVFNEDKNPTIINKRVARDVEYIQEMAIQYLKPPTPPAPGEIIITQMPNLNVKPAPPLIIRQQPVRIQTPEPLVVREIPPKPPAKVGLKRITISG